MAKNKKAQILAAVMCAATVAGISPAVSSAAEFIADEDGRAYVATHNNSIEGYATNDITFTVGNNTLAVNNNATTIGGVTIGADGAIEQQYKGFRVNANGDVTARSVTVDGFKINSPDGAYLDISGTKIYKDGGFSTGNMNFNVRPNGDLQMGPDNKITVQAATGNVTTQGNITTAAGADLNAINEKTGHISHTTLSADNHMTSVERMKFFQDGRMENENGTFKVDSNGSISASRITSRGNISSAGIIEAVGNGDVKAGGYSLKHVGYNTAGITRTDYGNDYAETVIEGATTFDSTGMTVGNLATDGQSTAITAGGATFNGKDGYTQISSGTVTASDDVQLADGTSLKNINANTAGIIRNDYGNGYAETVIEGATTFDSTGMTVGNLATDGQSTAITAGGATFNGKDGYTQISSGTVTASDDVVAGDVSLKNLAGDFSSVNANVAGITRDDLTETTIIEGNTYFDADGMSVGNLSTDGQSTAITAGKATFNGKDGYTQIQSGTVTASEDVQLADGTSLKNINANTAGITRTEYPNGMGETVIEGNTYFDANGMSIGNLATDGQSTAIAAGQATFNGKDGYTQIQGGTVTVSDDVVADGVSLKNLAGNFSTVNNSVKGINRIQGANGDWITSIENSIFVSETGAISLNASNFNYTYDKDGAFGLGNLGDLANRVDDIYNRTQGISYDEETGTTFVDGNLTVNDDVTGSGSVSGDEGTTESGNLVANSITADTGTIGGVTMTNGTISGENANIANKVTVGGENGTTITQDGITVGNANNGAYTSITNSDVRVTDSQGNVTSLTNVGNRVTGLENRMDNIEDRMGDVEDRIDKVGAMAAAIANLRTMGYDPEAPTEIAVGVGQYESETGLALGVFHYPNQDFMLSASISTSGDEVMGGIGATWKIGRKSSAEKARSVEEKRVAKAEEMQEMAKAEKVKAQRERHAKMLAERQQQEA